MSSGITKLLLRVQAEFMTTGCKTFPEIGERLIAIRKGFSDLTQKAWAEKHGFNQTQYSHWETGRHRIPIHAAEKLCEIYGLTLDAVYRGDLHGVPEATLKALLRTGTNTCYCNPHIVQTEQIDRDWIKARLTGEHGEQTRLADALGLTHDKVNKILAGKRRVQASEIPKLISYFTQSAETPDNRQMNKAEVFRQNDSERETDDIERRLLGLFSRLYDDEKELVLTYIRKLLEFSDTT